MHCPRDAEEINEDGTGKPNSWIVKHGFAGDDLSSGERGPNQQKPNDQNHLLLRNDGWMMDWTHGELSPGLDELDERLSQSGETALFHLVCIVFQGFRIGADEVDVGKGIDIEEFERGLGFTELEVTEEQLGVGTVVVGNERRGNEGEVVDEHREAEVGFVV